MLRLFWLLWIICDITFWHSCSNSPESGLGTSHTSLPGVDSDPDQFDGHAGGDPESEYYEADMLPIIGTCKALYPFEGICVHIYCCQLVFLLLFICHWFTATSEGSIPMLQDEELHLIEIDQGDGWTRVRRLDGDCEEGFVPTSYIEPLVFNT